MHIHKGILLFMPTEPPIYAFMHVASVSYWVVDLEIAHIHIVGIYGVNRGEPIMHTLDMTILLT